MAGSCLRDRRGRSIGGAGWKSGNCKESLGGGLKIISEGSNPRRKRKRGADSRKKRRDEGGGETW